VIAKGLLTIGIALALSFSASASGQTAQRFFVSPSGNISCEIDLFSAANRTAYCQTVSPAASITLFPDGHVKKCVGVRCLGNAPEGVRALAYGASTALGPFRCTSLTTGVRCVVSRSRHGFLINRSGVFRS
jgi:hypothetical protein